MGTGSQNKAQTTVLIAHKRISASPNSKILIPLNSHPIYSCALLGDFQAIDAGRL
jgi:hypothetical protein